MSVLGEVAKDLGKMFVADARMSAAALAVVAIAWGAARLGSGPLAGAVLALGALAVLLVGVARAARAARRRPDAPRRP